MIWQLKHENAFSDLGQLTALLGDAKQWLITNSGFDLFDFATNMSALTGKNLKFYTLPISGFADVELNGSMQDVNNIDVSYIQQVVNKAFNPPPPAAASGKSTAKKKAAPIPAASTVTVDVYNGGSTSGLAGSVSQALVSLGYKSGAVSDASAQSQTPPAGTRCSTVRARRPTRPRSRPISAPPPRPSRHCPRSTSRCCSAPGAPSSRLASPRPQRRRRRRRRPPRRRQRPTTGRPEGRSRSPPTPSSEYPACTNRYCVLLTQGGTAMLTAGLGRLIAGKVGYAAACLLAVVVIVVSGYAHRVVGYANGFNDGVSTGNAPSTSAQAMNILVMGLESRTNF